MTDEELAAVLRWQGSALQEGAFFAAADRIEQLVATNEQLTAERDALEQDNHRWKMECENFWRDREKDLTAECDRLRKELENIVADCEADYPPSHGAIKYAAKLALKGETP